MLKIKKLKEAFSREDFQTIDYGDGFKVYVGRADLKAYQDFLSDKWRQWEAKSKGSRRKEVSPEMLRDWQKEGFAKHLIRWEGAVGEDGQEIPPTAENILAAFNDPEKPTELSQSIGDMFFQEVLIASQNEAAYRAELLEDQAGK